MNSFQKKINSVLDTGSDDLELISRGQNKLRAIYRGHVFEEYTSLPHEVRYALNEAIEPYSKIYSQLREKYSHDEAEERIIWCLFGSLDTSIDINVETGDASVEVSSHCRACQYSKPFCRRTLANLTRREQEIFLLMRQGLTDKEIGNKLSISHFTVIKHIDNAVQKFREVTGTPVTKQYIITKLMEAGV